MHTIMKTAHGWGVYFIRERVQFKIGESRSPLDAAFVAAYLNGSGINASFPATFEFER
jgi:hypothetical protein